MFFEIEATSVRIFADNYVKGNTLKVEIDAIDVEEIVRRIINVKGNKFVLDLAKEE